jgi:hypothetical protein
MHILEAQSLKRSGPAKFFVFSTLLFSALFLAFFAAIKVVIFGSVVVGYGLLIVSLGYGSAMALFTLYRFSKKLRASAQS